jgi:hypothetical protein
VTTIIPFLPSNLVVPTFVATLDGDTYKVAVSWNIAAQRYYIDVYDSDDAWVVTVPLVATPPARKIESITYDPFRGVVTAQFVPPSQWPVPLLPSGLVTDPGTVVDYTLENFNPTVFNGLFRSIHINQLSFSFELVPNPGDVQVYGTVSRYMNLIGGLFTTSTLIYRNGAFEVSP